MSFFSTLMGAAVLPTDLASAGVVANANRVYRGRRRQLVQHTATEVWVEEVASPPTEGWGLQHIRRHEIRIHVRTKNNPGPDGTGSAQLDLIEAHLETLRDRYHGAVLFTGTFAGMLPARAVIEAVDDDPADEDVLDGVIRVTFAVKE